MGLASSLVNKQSVIFIDEIDALATRRQGIFSDKTDDLYNAATQERETTLNQPLIELDGFDTGKGVIFLGATNRKDLLDPALLRPGRFDRKIRIRPPNAKGRLEILQVHARKVKLSESVDLSVFAQNLSDTWYNHFQNSYSHIQSGAKLAQLLQEAALVAVRNKHKSILQSDVGEAVDRLTVGPKRVALDLGHQGQCRRATTEVGTALTSHLIRRTENADVEPCDRISIHPRGQTLSQVVFNRLDDEKYIFERRPQLLHCLQGQHISFSQQIQQVMDTFQQFILTMGEHAAADHISNSVFYISIGTNDFIHYYLAGEREFGKKGYDGNGALEIIKRLNLKGLKDNRSRDGVDYSQDVHLNDILRKFKGKLYVPEQIFVEELSEEAEFDREFELLPRMSFDDLQKTVRTNMIKFMTFKDDDKVAYVHKDLIVELKEILLVKLDGTQVQEVLKEYNGPRYEIETQTMGSTGVTFDDVAGIEIAVEEFQELVKYLKNPELFDKMEYKPPHGVLLEGPPGCGKVNKQSVIFIDEIDALATRRQGIFSDKTDDLYNAATQERETTLNQPLIELDGFDTGKGVIFLGATNRKDLLDPALLRPGRFDRKIRIRPPNAKGRLEILQVHARKVKLSESVDLSVFAQNLSDTWYNHFQNSYSHIQSGAKLAQLLQEAALVAVRNKHKSILQSDVGEAVDRLTVGPKRVALDLGHQGQCRRATTEVGTALTSHLIRRTENADTLSQVVFNRLDDEKYIFERRPQLLHCLQGQHISFSQQIQQVMDTFQQFILTMGEHAAADHISNSVFYISIGTNDFIHYYLAG
ncbi:hypothetical protein E3N88_41473 [Mikania micrantha]|uniref:ATPase AAA-type core domain-containing protein n=1 Tax=Mikania micrantha TaxID=192012 RepID=A0A5N6LQS2_9ASTR|nr:hypothetical protein E3N88_41473 [Mikania micrantha]